MSNFQNILKSLRKEHNLSQQEVANHLNITQSAYSLYERGKREPDIENLIKLAKLFKVPLDILMGRYVENNTINVNNVANNNINSSVNVSIGH